MKELSIIIPTKDRKEILNYTLNYISDNVRYDNGRFEIILVNDGVEEIEVRNIPERLNVILIECRQKSLARARNKGALNATGKYLLFLDDDILPSENHFERHLEIHSVFDNAIVTANRDFSESFIKEANKTPFGRYKLRYDYKWTDDIELKETNVIPGVFFSEDLAGFSCSMPRTIFEELNGFNEAFTDAGCEDSEFFRRAHSSGKTLLFDKENYCEHNETDNLNLKNWLYRQGTGSRSAVVICQIFPEGKLHPSYFLNTKPDLKKDNLKLIIKKTIRTILKWRFSFKILYFKVLLLEKMNFPDKLLFKFYNALWISETVYYFREKIKSSG